MPNRRIDWVDCVAALTALTVALMAIVWGEPKWALCMIGIVMAQLLLLSLIDVRHARSSHKETSQ
jgi:hypothetical protein